MNLLRNFAVGGGDRPNRLRTIFDMVLVVGSVMATATAVVTVVALFAWLYTLPTTESALTPRSAPPRRPGAPAPEAAQPANPPAPRAAPPAAAKPAQQPPAAKPAEQPAAAAPAAPTQAAVPEDPAAVEQDAEAQSQQRPLRRRRPRVARNPSDAGGENAASR